jgi:hypothetical protein
MVINRIKNSTLILHPLIKTAKPPAALIINLCCFQTGLFFYLKEIHK